MQQPKHHSQRDKGGLRSSVRGSLETCEGNSETMLAMKVIPNKVMFKSGTSMRARERLQSCTDMTACLQPRLCVGAIFLLCQKGFISVVGVVMQ